MTSDVVGKIEVRFIRITRLGYFRIETYALVPKKSMLNEYFGVGVVSVAKDGVVPALNPGWVRRRINTCPEVRHELILSALYKIESIYVPETAIILLAWLYLN